MIDDISQTVEPARGALPDPPGANGARRRRRLSRIDSALAAHFSGRPDVLVSGGGYLRRDPLDETERLAPDCLVAFGVEDPDSVIERNGYVIGEVGKPPDFVLDIADDASPSADADDRRERCAAYGAGEYWRFAETAETADGSLSSPLAGGELVDGAYVHIPIRREPDGVLWGYSRALGLRLRWDRGELRFADPETGAHLPDAEGLRWRAEAAEALAAVSRTRAVDSESIIADAQARIADTEARIAELEDRMEAAEARLAKAEADLDEIRARVQAVEARADAQAASEHISEMMRRQRDD